MSMHDITDTIESARQSGWRYRPAGLVPVEEVARAFDCSVETVRQIEIGALLKLKQACAERGIEPQDIFGAMGCG